MAEFFGQYDLLGNPRYEDICGRISIRSTKYIAYEINRLDDSMDLLFHGLDGVNELIFRLTQLRDQMAEIIAHKDYWEGDIPTQSEETKGE